MTDSAFDTTSHLYQFPNGQAAKVIGDQGRWSGALATGSPSAICLAAVLHAFGKSAITLPSAASLADLEDAIRSTGLVATRDQGESLEDLALNVELGRAVMALVNAGIAWNAPAAVEHGLPNHSLLVAAVARSEKGDELLGAFVRDPIRPETSFLTADQLERCWLRPGGILLTAVVDDDEKDFYGQV